MEYTHFFTGGLVGGNGRLEPVCRYPFELHVSGESGDEVDTVLTVRGPVHEVVGTEVRVATNDYLRMLPMLAQFEYQPLEQSGNVDGLVAASRSEYWKDYFPLRPSNSSSGI